MEDGVFFPISKANDMEKVTTVDIKTPVLTGLAFDVVGILMIVLRDFITGPGIMITAGILFIVAGMVNFAIALFVRDENGQRKSRGWLFALTCAVSVASVALGICVFAFQNTFVGLIPILFGTLLALQAVILFYTLGFAMRPYRLPGWMYILPTLVAVSSAFVFTLESPADDRRIMIFAGVGFILFGVCAVVGALCLVKTLKSLKKEMAVTEAAENVKEIKSLDDEQ